MEQNKAVFAKLPLFASLTESEIDQVFNRAKKVSFNEGHVIFQEGDTGGSLFIVLEGAVRISTMVKDKLEKPLVTIHAGSVFGEVSLVDKNPREAKATVVEKAELLTLDSKDFEVLSQEHPVLGAKILKFLLQTLVNRVRNISEQYRRNIQWGLSVSGALRMNWHQLITDEVDIHLDLSSGQSVLGKFLKVEDNSVGYEIFVQTKDDKVFIIPYHAILSISFRRLDTRTPVAELEQE